MISVDIREYETVLYKIREISEQHGKLNSEAGKLVLHPEVQQYIKLIVFGRREEAKNLESESPDVRQYNELQYIMRKLTREFHKLWLRKKEMDKLRESSNNQSYQLPQV